MTCGQVHRLLSVSREWTGRERATAKAHLAECPNCWSVAREYELMDRRLGRLPHPAMETALPSTVQARLLVEKQTAKSQSPAWSHRAVQGAGLLAVVMLIAVVNLLSKGGFPIPATESGLVAVAPTHVAVPETWEADPSLFSWPVTGTLTQTFWPGHRAVDLANLPGTPVYAAGDGVVTQVGVDLEHGNYLLLDHGDGYESFYSHLLRITVEKDWLVAEGQKIGEMGGTGKATGPHLHFEIRKDGECLNPLEVVSQEEQAGKLLSYPVSGTDSLPAKPERGGFSWPTDGYVTQTYWMGHQAVDIANRSGAPVYAAGDGIVLLSAEEDRHGIHLLLDHGDGYTTLYSHMSAVHVEVGEEVKAGQKIGAVGSTGLSTGPHLHFEIRKDGEPVNPLKLMVEQ